ncbi:hypothetical protein PR048_027903 [Dryococelus australis]|uniref:Uncharacterized protein n=1 Tax=Dryococelus australis TaxID=614101 RepID=A0ABQ9GHS0_9NEOP|nr:hypothetical protein PR048_027903 [Dryococelus australis]
MYLEYIVELILELSEELTEKLLEGLTEELSEELNVVLFVELLCCCLRMLRTRSELKVRQTKHFPLRKVSTGLREVQMVETLAKFLSNRHKGLEFLNLGGYIQLCVGGRVDRIEHYHLSFLSNLALYTCIPIHSLRSQLGMQTVFVSGKDTILAGGKGKRAGLHVLGKNNSPTSRKRRLGWMVELRWREGREGVEVCVLGRINAQAVRKTCSGVGVVGCRHLGEMWTILERSRHLKSSSTLMLHRRDTGYQLSLVFTGRLRRSKVRMEQLHIHLISPSSALETSLRAAQISQLNPNRDAALQQVFISRVSGFEDGTTSGEFSPSPNITSPLREYRSSVGMREPGGEGRIPVKTRRPAASSGTIPTCGNTGATPPPLQRESDPFRLGGRQKAEVTVNGLHGRNVVRTVPGSPQLPASRGVASPAGRRPVVGRPLPGVRRSKLCPFQHACLSASPRRHSCRNRGLPAADKQAAAVVRTAAHVTLGARSFVVGAADQEEWRWVCPAVVNSLPESASGNINKVEPMIDVNMEQRRNERAGETGDPRKNPPTNGTVRHDSYMRKPGVTRPGIKPGSPW